MWKEHKKKPVATKDKYNLYNFIHRINIILYL